MSEELDRLDWLVRGRAANQIVLFELYQIISENEERLISVRNDLNTAQMLLGVAFSLWRAVFLNEIQDNQEAVYADVVSFAKNLVESNMVGFTQDRSSRNWTFRFYVQCARDRLERLKKAPGMVLLPAPLPNWSTLRHPKDVWQTQEALLETAVKNFRVAISSNQ